MNITLIAPESLKQIVDHLTHQGHRFSYNEINNSDDLSILIFQDRTLARMTRDIKSARKKMNSGNPLLACVPQISQDERRAMAEAGATMILVPAAWTTKALAERIGGELSALSEPKPRCGTLIGGSRLMRVVYEDITPLARIRKDLLLLGESGTGKELLAKSIHELGPNSADPFIAINCAELKDQLLVSRLYGHKRGSFTGAVSDHTGAFFAAKKGTVFLDEVGELEPLAQAQLLRALQERMATVLGENHPKKFNARILLATNRDLAQDRESHDFRDDLFARFEGFIIKLPPLRDRMEDVPLLARHFIERFNSEEDRQNKISDAAVDLLMNCSWPRNVRQLSQFVESAAAFANEDDDPISLFRLKRLLDGVEDVPPMEASEFLETDTWVDVKNRTWLAYAEFVQSLENGDTKKAAKRAGMSRSAFYDRIKKAKSHNSE